MKHASYPVGPTSSYYDKGTALSLPHLITWLKITLHGHVACPPVVVLRGSTHSSITLYGARSVLPPQPPRKLPCDLALPAVATPSRCCPFLHDLNSVTSRTRVLSGLLSTADQFPYQLSIEVITLHL